MKRVLSGIKPSGEVTIGNYLGAMKRWAEEQEGRENFYFVPNLHALTTLRDADKLRRNTLSDVAWLLTMGVDPDKSLIFVQSQIPAHAELCWILDNFVTMGELSRMTQFKDKSRKLGAQGQIAGLFNYPVLMAADILLYDADEVPVGEDQKQHVELTRDIAKRFNNQYGAVFKLPKAIIPKAGARIMDLQHPAQKMDKSSQDLSGVIMMGDPPGEVKNKILKAVTDSGKVIKFDPKAKPAVSNLLQIYAMLAGKEITEIEKKYRQRGYGEFKADLADIAISKLVKLREKHQELMADEAKLLNILEAGRVKAEAISNQKLDQVKQKLGLL